MFLFQIDVKKTQYWWHWAVFLVCVTVFTVFTHLLLSKGSSTGSVCQVSFGGKSFLVCHILRERTFQNTAFGKLLIGSSKGRTEIKMFCLSQCSLEAKMLPQFFCLSSIFLEEKTWKMKGDTKQIKIKMELLATAISPPFSCLLS